MCRRCVSFFNTFNTCAMMPDKMASHCKGNLSINSLNLDLFLCPSSVNKGNKTTAAPFSALSVAHVTDKTVTPISLWPNCSLSTFGQKETSLFPPLERGVESNAGHRHRVLENRHHPRTSTDFFHQMNVETIFKDACS